MIVRQFDTVILKDGREAAVVEAYENKYFIVDVGSSPKDWETIDVRIEDIERVVENDLQAERSDLDAE